MCAPCRRFLSVLGSAWVAVAAAGCGDASSTTAGLQSAFGRTGTGPREFSYPRATVIGPDQRLYVVDKSARIQCFTLDGEFVREWRMPEFAAGKPTGLGVSLDGRIYVADTHNARVVVFEPDGRLVTQFGSRGEGPGQFLMPTDVAVDHSGFIYVGEYGGNDRISKFAPDFGYVLSFGRPGSGPGELQRPQSLHVASDDTLWVADSCNHRICHFDPNGQLVGSFGESGSGLGKLRFPYGLDQLSDGTLVVAEYGSNRVQRFDPTGRPLGAWGRAGRQPGELAYPWAVVIGPNDRMFIIDSGNNRIQIVDARARGAWLTR